MCGMTPAQLPADLAVGNEPIDFTERFLQTLTAPACYIDVTQVRSSESRIERPMFAPNSGDLNDLSEVR